MAEQENNQLTTAAPSAMIQKQLQAAKDIILVSGGQLTEKDAMLLSSMYQSGYFKDIDSLSKAVTRVVFGKQIGIDVAMSLTSLYIIDGKPGLEAKAIRNQLRSAGYEIVPSEVDDRGCILQWSYKGEKLGESKFDVNDAVLRGYIDPMCQASYPVHAKHDVSKWGKREGRYITVQDCNCKDNWKKMPQEMFIARATTRGNDRFGGKAFSQEVYDIDELHESPFRVDTEPMEIALGQIKNSTSIDELRDVADNLTPEQLSQVEDALTLRTQELLDNDIQ